MLFCFSLVIYTPFFIFFFFNDTATTEIYTLSLHDALPIWLRTTCQIPAASRSHSVRHLRSASSRKSEAMRFVPFGRDRKSTRLNSSHSQISYAVFCLKKKKKERNRDYVKSTPEPHPGSAAC